MSLQSLINNPKELLELISVCLKQKDIINKWSKNTKHISIYGHFFFIFIIFNYNIIN